MDTVYLGSAKVWIEQALEDAVRDSGVKVVLPSRVTVNPLQTFERLAALLHGKDNKN